MSLLRTAIKAVRTAPPAVVCISLLSTLPTMFEKADIVTWPTCLGIAGSNSASAVCLEDLRPGAGP